MRVRAGKVSPNMAPTLSVPESCFVWFNKDIAMQSSSLSMVEISLLSLLTGAVSTERLIEILREFPPEEPTRKRYIQEMISWSSKFGPIERGDPELHHAAGSVYAEGRARCPLLRQIAGWAYLTI